jgi:hypothetical protein
MFASGRKEMFVEIFYAIHMQIDGSNGKLSDISQMKQVVPDVFRCKFKGRLVEEFGESCNTIDVIVNSARRKPA